MVPSVRRGTRNPLKNLCETPSGTTATVLFLVGRAFFHGDTPLKELGWTNITVTHSVLPSGPVLTAMATDPRPDGLSTLLPRVDWELYRRLKSEGRLNLLFRFSGPTAPSLQSVGTPTPRPNVLPFISRAEHLAWREQWRNGRWVKSSWTAEERRAILRQDEAYRQADARWQLNHGPVLGGARVLLFSVEATDRSYSHSNCSAGAADGR
jgi:hypothetical protein